MGVLLPTKYEEFKDVFVKENVCVLQEHQPYNYPIDCQPYEHLYKITYPS